MKKRKLALYGAAGLAVIILLPMLALTIPKIATPLANNILDGRAPEGSKVEKAYLNFPKLFTLTIEGLDAPNLANVQRADFTYNPFGFIPALDMLRHSDHPIEINRSRGPYLGPVLYDFASTSDDPAPTPKHVLRWDPDAGLLRTRTARGLTATGFLAQSSPIAIDATQIISRNHHGSIVLLALDDLPLSTARRLLIQAVTEDRPTGWRTRAGVIENLGGLPWRVRTLDASIAFAWAGPAPRRVVALDGNGVAAPSDETWSLDDGRLHVTLPKDRLYTLIRTMMLCVRSRGRAAL